MHFSPEARELAPVVRQSLKEHIKRKSRNENRKILDKIKAGYIDADNTTFTPYHFNDTVAFFA